MNERSVWCLCFLLAASCRGGDTLLVTSGYTDEIVQVRASDGEVVQRIPIDPRPSETDEPHGLALAPDGRYWYATVSHGEPTLWKFERPTNRLVGRVRLETFGAGRIGITPDGRMALVPDYYRDGGAAPSHVAVVRLHDLVLLRAPIVCPAPHDAAVSPDGTRAAITCSAGDEIVLLDPATGAETGRFFVDTMPGPAGTPRFRPLNAVWSPAGDRLYVTMHLGRAVRAFDVTGHPVGDAPTGSGPAQLGISADGGLLVTANRGDNSVSIIALPDLREVRRVPVGVPHPHGVALEPVTNRAFISYEGDSQTLGGVVAIEVASGEVIWTRELASYATGVIYLPEGSR